MALARVKVWVAGEILTAADLNAEFNNILNNPTALISPFTANLNANGKQITNLALENLGASPSAGTAGRIWWNTATTVKQVEVDDGAFIRTVPSVLATSLTPGDILYAVAGSSQGGNPSWTRLGNAASSFLHTTLVSATSGPIFQGTPAQAFCAFIGNTTSSSMTPIVAYGVSTAANSIVQDSSGTYTIPWINQFQSSNYAVTAWAGRTTEGSGTVILVPTSSAGLSTGNVQIRAFDGVNVSRPFYISVIAYGPIV